MLSQPFRPGFRIDAIDVAVLAAGLAGSILAARLEWWMGVAIGFVVGHFFLFCNVFRVARSLELAWSALFLVLAGSTMTTAAPGWRITFGTSLLATCLVVGLQLRKPSYHGFGWQRLNPGLPQWWQAQGKASRGTPVSREFQKIP